MKKTVLTVLLLYLYFTAGLVAQERSGDEQAVRKLVEQMTSMWTSQDGVAVFQHLSSGQHFLFVSQGSLLNREEFSRLLQSIRDGNSVAAHSHNIEKIVITGKLAVDLGTMELANKAGSEDIGGYLGAFKCFAFGTA